MSDIKDRLEESRKMLQLLDWHKETLEEQLNREGKKLGSQVMNIYGEKNVTLVTTATPEQLTARMQYFYYAKELIDVVAEIRVKTALVENYKAHYDTTLKEETKAVSDREILAAINEMNNLPLKGELKQTANNLANDFTTGGVVGLVPRFEYLEMVRNFIKANS